MARKQQPDQSDRKQTETFDAPSLTPPGKAIVQHELTHLVEHEGLEKSAALQVDYEGYERGSRRVVVHPQIMPSIRYELSYWVRFCEDFDFARGGKLHGVGPANPIDAGRAMTPEGWSARLGFKGDGGLQTYVYHQDMQGQYGESVIAEDFRFQPGTYHHILMQVALNEPAQVPNGYIKVWVDDELLIEHQRLRFRDRLTPESEIQRFLFNTFHGGSGPEWAPRNEDGSYKSDCAFFDDIELTPSFSR